jgi:tetratricopeptide (TPR) repeat protein
MFRKIMFFLVMIASCRPPRRRAKTSSSRRSRTAGPRSSTTSPRSSTRSSTPPSHKRRTRVSEANPNVPAVLIWEGIIVSSEAGARGGLGALSLAKQARKLLEESLKLDEGAMNGSAYTSLGTLYAKVPRWPIGFGDKDRAEKLFRKALEINPEGIDANFFYGEYLVERHRVAEGRSHLERALAAPPRPGRELADAGRRREIQALLKTIESETVTN